jgi:hypothetical protein
VPVDARLEPRLEWVQASPEPRTCRGRRFPPLSTTDSDIAGSESFFVRF